MNALDKLNIIKQKLLEDLKKSIIYTPDRERDIYFMMNRYLSDEVSDKKKEKILANLSKCINGVSYKQPKGAVTKKYTMDYVDEVNELLDKFLEEAKNNPEKIQELSEILDEELGGLDCMSEGYLIAPWRKKCL